MLIIFAGLPGTGKSTLAGALAQRLGALYLRIDSIERALAASSLAIHPAQDAGYVVGYALAEDNLTRGRSVVADSVNPIDLTRDAWRAVAQRAGRPAVDVEVVCSDVEEHRRRIETREPDIPGFTLPTWQDVLNRDYDAWNDPRLVIDTAARAPEQALDALLAQLPAA